MSNNVFTALAICIGIAWIAYVVGGVALFMYRIFNQQYFVIGILLALVSSYLTGDAKETIRHEIRKTQSR